MQIARILLITMSWLVGVVVPASAQTPPNQQAASPAPTDPPLVTSPAPAAQPQAAATAADMQTLAEMQVKAVEASAATAKASAESAKANSEVVAAAAVAAKEAKFEDLKSGSFIQYGVSAGFAFVIQSASLGEGTDGAEQESYAATSMPYIVIAPAYWLVGDITATYCATAWGADDATAAEAAAAYAIKKAVARLSINQKKSYDSELALPSGSATPTIDLVELDAKDEWDPKLRGRCAPTQWGVFLGKPLSYDASVREADFSPQRKREVDTAATFGLAFMPNAYVTILAGLSLNTLTIEGTDATDDEPAQPERLRRFVSLTFGLGGNLDVVGTLFR